MRRGSAFVGTNARITAATLALLLVCLSFRDLIPRGPGVGYDGAAYAYLARVMSVERVHNLLSGRERTILQGHTHVVAAAMFSPSGDRILTASYDGTAQLWVARPRDLLDLADERRTRELTAYERMRYAELLDDE